MKCKIRNHLTKCKSSIIVQHNYYVTREPAGSQYLIMYSLWVSKSCPFPLNNTRLSIDFLLALQPLCNYCCHLLCYLLRVNITYVDRDGERHEVTGKVGDNVLYLAHRYGIELEGWCSAACPVHTTQVTFDPSGACEASLACTTCHVYVEGDYFDRLSEATEEYVFSYLQFVYVIVAMDAGKKICQIQPHLYRRIQDLVGGEVPVINGNCILFFHCIGCQIILSKELDGIELTLPRVTRNFYVDGHTPQPH